jgi:hypothetical protein
MTMTMMPSIRGERPRPNPSHARRVNFRRLPDRTPHISPPDPPDIITLVSHHPAESDLIGSYILTYLHSSSLPLSLSLCAVLSKCTLHCTAWPWDLKSKSCGRDVLVMDAYLGSCLPQGPDIVRSKFMRLEIHTWHGNTYDYSVLYVRNANVQSAMCRIDDSRSEHGRKSSTKPNSISTPTYLVHPTSQQARARSYILLSLTQVGLAIMYTGDLPDTLYAHE